MVGIEVCVASRFFVDIESELYEMVLNLFELARNQTFSVNR